ncbi:MAG: CbiX/SirB N-terminal domain-containing protein, partial [Phycisphaerae bacterium]
MVSTHSTPTQALVLAAHGSSHSDGVAAILDRIVADLRAGPAFDSVTACYHRQPPYFRDVLDAQTADRIVVVPMMTSGGYFSRVVLPERMGLTGPVTYRNGQTIHLTAPLGEHARMPNLMAARVRSTLKAHRLDPSLTAVILVGHGTRRDPQSASLTERHAASLRRRKQVSQVVTAFLDQPPELEEVHRLTDLPILIVVPYLLGGGKHAIEDLPARLGIRSAGPAGSRRTFLTPSPFEDPA